VLDYQKELAIIAAWADIAFAVNALAIDVKAANQAQ
jgi:hypothetical protein